MKIVAIRRRSRKKTRVLLEDGFELCVDTDTDPKVGDDIQLGSSHTETMVKSVLSPLAPDEPVPELLTL